jgi:hypothetical protein
LIKELIFCGNPRYKLRIIGSYYFKEKYFCHILSILRISITKHKKKLKTKYLKKH